MAGLQNLLEAYRNYRGVQEWKLGKQEEQMLGGDPQAMGLWEKLQGFGPADMGGIAGAIKTYHGSPYIKPFTKFSQEALGGGEGMMAYGRGHYVAQDPRIAKKYAELYHPMYTRSSPKEWGDVSEKEKWFLEAYNNPVKGLQEALEEQRKHVNLVMQSIERSSGRQREVLEMGLPHNIEKLKELESIDPNLLASLGKLKKTTPIEGPHGSVYETSLEWPEKRELTDPMSHEHFLAWDKKLSDQPENIRRALEDISRSNPEILPSTKKIDIKKTLRHMFLDEGPLEQMLLERGVPGVSYLDQYSTKKGTINPTYNYAVFGDEIPRIVSHNNPSILKMLWPKFNK